MQFRKQMIVIGDRVLLQLDDGQDKTKSGLYLPASVREKEKVAMGRVVRVGPGYPIPNPNYTEDEPWSTQKDPMRYIPLQAKKGITRYFCVSREWKWSLRRSNTSSFRNRRS